MTWIVLKVPLNPNQPTILHCTQVTISHLFKFIFLITYTASPIFAAVAAYFDVLFLIWTNADILIDKHRDLNRYFGTCKLLVFRDLLLKTWDLHTSLFWTDTLITMPNVLCQFRRLECKVVQQCPIKIHYPSYCNRFFFTKFTAFTEDSGQISSKFRCNICYGVKLQPLKLNSIFF